MIIMPFGGEKNAECIHLRKTLINQMVLTGRGRVLSNQEIQISLDQS
jgi:hypothetical protein